MRLVRRRQFIVSGIGGTGGGGVPDLTLLGHAEADGAATAFTFEESSGNFVNHIDGTYPITQIGTQVQRAVAAPGDPDLKGATFLTTAQAWPSYGYARGWSANGGGRPSQNGFFRAANEIVARVNGAGQINKLFVQGQCFGGGGLHAYAMGLDAVGNVYVYLPLAFTTLTILGSGADALNWHHYLWQYTDDGLHQLWVDGVKEEELSVGISGAGLFDVSEANRIMNVGGGDEGDAKNIGATVAFFASYLNMELSPAQIGAHAAAAGV